MTELIENLGLKQSASQVGKVLTKLAEKDGRIRSKTPNNKKLYFLPPMGKSTGYYHCVEDFESVLMDAKMQPDTSAPKAS